MRSVQAQACLGGGKAQACFGPRAGWVQKATNRERHPWKLKIFECVGQINRNMTNQLCSQIDQH